MPTYKNSLVEFVNKKLNENSYGIKFDTRLFSYKDQEDFNDTEQDEESYNMIDTQYVPTIIPDFSSNYIEVPNVNTTNNVFGVYFYLFNDDVPLNKEEEFLSVDYENTLLAIDEFIQVLLAKYHIMGTPYLFFGGDDSSLEKVGVNVTNVESITFDFIPLNNDTETLLSNGLLVNGKLTKDANSVHFNYDLFNQISIPYTINTLMELVITNDGTNWTITDGINTDTVVNNTLWDYNDVNIGHTTGCEIKLKSFSISDNIIVTEFLDKDIIVNEGSEQVNLLATNCILWGDEGNLVLGFNGLTAVSGLDVVNGYNRQQFFIDIEATVSDNAIFGNNFEYYLDGNQVYPVGRTHTYGAISETRQKLGKEIGKSVIQEALLGLETTFFYIPNKQMNSLIKKITTKEVAQNQVYELKIQYPFYSVTKNVVIDTGGLNAMVNTLATFTIEYKDSDEILDS